MPLPWYEGETLFVEEKWLYGTSVEEKLMTVLWYVCGGEMMVFWYVSGGEMTAYDGEGMYPKVKAHYICCDWDGILLLAVSVSQARTQTALCTSYLSCLGYSYILLCELERGVGV